MGPPASANDTLATLAAGGLIPVKSAQIAMEREELEISVHQITIRYRFRNQSDRDVDATMAFPLPDLEGGTVEHVPLQLPVKGRTNFVDFAVSAAGRPVETKMEVRAVSYQGRDITERLRGAGLPLSVVDSHFADVVRRLSPQQRQAFEKEDLIASDDGGHTRWPAWITKVQFYWTQHFPAHGVVELEQKYRPVVGGSYVVPTDSGASHVKPYCAGPEVLSQIAAVKQKHPVRNPDEPALYERQIKYILTTANNWSGPIRDFRLSMVTDDADDILLTCMPGVRRVAPTRWEVIRSNFRPDRELELLILQAGRR